MDNQKYWAWRFAAFPCFGSNDFEYRWIRGVESWAAFVQKPVCESTFTPGCNVCQEEPAKLESNEMLRERLCNMLSRGEVYMAEDIGNANTEQLDALAESLGTSRKVKS